MKDALIMVIANHMKKSYLSWNKDSVKDEVIFEHLYELSEGKINLSKKEEELSTTANLIQVNKKQSNKTNYSNQKSNKKFNKHNNHPAKGKK
jgi:vacuolar-type H+-ATPase catalytic subunit A/Vma1